jgi:hypothetical protein
MTSLWRPGACVGRTKVVRLRGYAANAVDLACDGAYHLPGGARGPSQNRGSRVRGRQHGRLQGVRFPLAPGVYLVRVVVDPAPQAEIVVTVYRTSKIDKYWRMP